MKVRKKVRDFDAVRVNAENEAEVMRLIARAGVPVQSSTNGLVMHTTNGSVVLKPSYGFVMVLQGDDITLLKPETFEADWEVVSE